MLPAAALDVAAVASHTCTASSLLNFYFHAKLLSFAKAQEESLRLMYLYFASSREIDY